ncbi:MAG: hypothetical protein ACK4NP_12350 [Parvularculaceae bacterium]
MGWITPIIVLVSIVRQIWPWLDDVVVFCITYVLEPVHQFVIALVEALLKSPS